MGGLETELNLLKTQVRKNSLNIAQIVLTSPDPCHVITSVRTQPLSSFILQPERGYNFTGLVKTGLHQGKSFPENWGGTHSVCGKPQERVSPILITLTSRSDSNFEQSNINLKENKRDGIDSNSNGFDYYVRKNEGKILWFSADCVDQCT